MAKTLKIAPLAEPSTMAEHRAFAEKLAQARSDITDFVNDAGHPFSVATYYLATLLSGSKSRDLKSSKQEDEYKRLIDPTRPDRGQQGFHWIVKELMGHIAATWNKAFLELSSVTYESYSAMWKQYSQLEVFYPEEAKIVTTRRKIDEMRQLLMRHRHYHAFSSLLTNHDLLYGPFTRLKDLQKFVQAHERNLLQAHGYVAPPSASSFGAPAHGAFNSNSNPSQEVSDQICRNFARKGHCRFKDKCKYKHVSRPSVQTLTQPINPYITVCKPFWLKGTCSNANCSKPHKSHNELWRARPKPPNCPVCGKHKKPKLTYCSSCYYEKFPERKRTTGNRQVEHANFDMVLDRMSQLDAKLAAIQAQPSPPTDTKKHCSPPLPPSSSFSIPEVEVKAEHIVNTKDLTKDVRLMLEFLPGLEALADIGGQISICGEDDMTKLVARITMTKRKQC